VENLCGDHVAASYCFGRRHCLGGTVVADAFGEVVA